MKIQLFDRDTCINKAKELKVNTGLTLDEVNKIPTSDLLHGLPVNIFSSSYFTVVHTQYDGDDNPNVDNIVGYNISVDRYGTPYFVQKEFVKTVSNAVGDIEIVDLK